MLVTLVDQDHEPFCKWHPARVAINRFYRDNSQFDNKSRYEPACSDCFRSYIHFIRSVPRDFSAANSQKDRRSARGNHCTRWVERERIEGKRKKKGKGGKKRRKKMFSYTIISEWRWTTRDMGTLKKSWNSFELETRFTKNSYHGSTREFLSIRQSIS